MNSKNTMWLSHFILDHMEPILQAWEEFAKTIEPPAFTKMLDAGLGKVGDFELNMAERLDDLPAA